MSNILYLKILIIVYKSPITISITLVSNSASPTKNEIRKEYSLKDN